MLAREAALIPAYPNNTINFSLPSRVIYIGAELLVFIDTDN